MDPADRNRLILEIGFVVVALIAFFTFLWLLPWHQV